MKEWYKNTRTVIRHKNNHSLTKINEFSEFAFEWIKFHILEIISNHIGLSDAIDTLSLNSIINSWLIAKYNAHNFDDMKNEYKNAQYASRVFGKEDCKYIEEKIMEKFEQIPSWMQILWNEDEEEYTIQIRIIFTMLLKHDGNV